MSLCVIDRHYFHDRCAAFTECIELSFDNEDSNQSYCFPALAAHHNVPLNVSVTAIKFHVLWLDARRRPSVWPAQPLTAEPRVNCRIPGISLRQNLAGYVLMLVTFDLDSLCGDKVMQTYVDSALSFCVLSINSNCNCNVLSTVNNSIG